LTAKIIPLTFCDVIDRVTTTMTLINTARAVPGVITTNIPVFTGEYDTDVFYAEFKRDVSASFKSSLDSLLKFVGLRRFIDSPGVATPTNTAPTMLEKAAYADCMWWRNDPAYCGDKKNKTHIENNFLELTCYGPEKVEEGLLEACEIYDFVDRERQRYEAALFEGLEFDYYDFYYGIGNPLIGGMPALGR
jgi:hypothetical protein